MEVLEFFFNTLFWMLEYKEVNIMLGCLLNIRNGLVSIEHVAASTMLTNLLTNTLPFGNYSGNLFIVSLISALLLCNEVSNLEH